LVTLFENGLRVTIHKNVGTEGSLNQLDMFQNIRLTHISMILSILFMCLIFQMPYSIHGEVPKQAIQIPTGTIYHSTIVVNDPKLKAELVTNQLEFPTTMDFLGPNDILVLEKGNGTVMRVNGSLVSGPLLDVNVATGVEQGMLGIAITKDRTNDKYPRYVYLYYTEAKIKDGGEPVGNRRYRYELVRDKLLNPKLILNLPVSPGPFHNGGKIRIGPDNNIYIIIGDLFRAESNDFQITKAQNMKNGREPNGIGGILRLTENGQAVGNGILGKEYPLNLYYGYGIRNGFGIDFDPVTGNLWDTENGPNFGDEINLVEPGFNSGWRKVQGIWKVNGSRVSDAVENHPLGLEDFGLRGKYSPPELSWKRHYGITSLKFYNSTVLGEQYENGIFVGDYHFGNIYYFQLNQDRTALFLNGRLIDKVADDNEEVKKKMFATGFSLGISDIQVGPDGYLYIVAHGQGSIYRVCPQNN
jgi:aldose sugar dehydrogenase